MHASPVAPPQPEICPQPSISPPSTAVCCPLTEWSTAGTVSGVTPGVTTVPFFRVTEDGIPRHRWVWSHQYPSTLSKVWFSRYSTTMCWTGTVLAAWGAGAPSTPSGSAAAANAATGSTRVTLTGKTSRVTGARPPPGARPPATRQPQTAGRGGPGPSPGPPAVTRLRRGVTRAGPRRGLVKQACPRPQSPSGAVAVLPFTEPLP